MSTSLYQVASATASPNYIKPPHFPKKSSSFHIFVVLLRYPYQNNRIIRELLCLVYHGSLLLTTTFFAFRVHLLWMNCHFLHFILQRRSHYGQLSEFLPGNDFPTRPYTPHSDILLHLYFCLSGLSFRLPMQRPSRCLLAGTPRFYPLATESPFPILRSRPLSPFCIRLDYVPAKSGI